MRGSWRRILILAALSSATILAPVANAVPLQTISGTVRDVDAQPLSGVRVTDGLGQWTYTDAQGRYRIEEEVPLAYEIRVSRLGIMAQSKVVYPWDALLGPTDFTVKYALDSSIDGYSISKSDGQMVTLTLTSYAPHDRSQVVIDDSRVAGTQLASFISSDPSSGASVWTYTISINPDTPNGIYELSGVARSLTTNADMSIHTSWSYEVTD